MSVSLCAREETVPSQLSPSSTKRPASVSCVSYRCSGRGLATGDRRCRHQRRERWLRRRTAMRLSGGSGSREDCRSRGRERCTADQADHKRFPGGVSIEGHDTVLRTGKLPIETRVRERRRGSFPRPRIDASFLRTGRRERLHRGSAPRLSPVRDPRGRVNLDRNPRAQSSSARNPGSEGSGALCVAAPGDRSRSSSARIRGVGSS